LSFPIGILSEKSGVKVETIRYYERIDLIPAPSRSPGGRRVYGEPDVKRLSFVRRGRELGFSLDDIRGMFRLADRGHSCGDVRELTLAHAARIRSKIDDLVRMERVLVDTAAKCEGGEAPECPVLDVLGR
jgi:MerR family mercuric resistance operon transcriptional regulator